MQPTFERLAFPRLHIHALDDRAEPPDAYDCIISGGGALTWQ
jgi:hypothetical protein